MDGVTITLLSGDFDELTSQRLKKKIKKMGGHCIVGQYLSVQDDEQEQHFLLVDKRKIPSKHEDIVEDIHVAFEKRIPIVHSAFVDDSFNIWEERKKAKSEEERADMAHPPPYTQYVLPLYGVHASITGFTKEGQSKRSSITETIVELGGFDDGCMSTKTNILIAEGDEQSDKYEFAVQNQIPVMKKDWLDRCRLHGSQLSRRYCFEGTPLPRRTALPRELQKEKKQKRQHKKRRHASADPVASRASAASTSSDGFVSNTVVVQQTLAQPAVQQPSTVVPQEDVAQKDQVIAPLFANESMLQLANKLRLDANQGFVSNCLDGVCAVLIAFYDETGAQAVHLLRQMGAKRLDPRFSNKATHCIVQFDAIGDGEAQYINNLPNHVHVVSFEWLHQCALTRTRVEETEFMQQDSKTESYAKYIMEAKTVQDNQVVHVEEIDTDIVMQVPEVDQPVADIVEHEEYQDVPAQQDMAEHASQPTLSEPTLECSIVELFSSKTFCLEHAGEDRDKAVASLKSVLDKSGQKPLIRARPDQADYTVFGAQAPEELPDIGNSCAVSARWLVDCAKADRVLPLNEHFLYRPIIRSLEPIDFNAFIRPGRSRRTGNVFSIAYVGDRKARIVSKEDACTLVAALGGQISPNLSKTTSIVLCLSERYRFQMAHKQMIASRGVYVVNTRWLFACAEACRFVPPSEDHLMIEDEIIEIAAAASKTAASSTPAADLASVAFSHVQHYPQFDTKDAMKLVDDKDNASDSASVSSHKSQHSSCGRAMSHSDVCSVRVSEDFAASARSTGESIRHLEPIESSVQVQQYQERQNSQHLRSASDQGEPELVVPVPQPDIIADESDAIVTENQASVKPENGVFTSRVASESVSSAPRASPRSANSSQRLPTHSSVPCRDEDKMDETGDDEPDPRPNRNASQPAPAQPRQEVQEQPSPSQKSQPGSQSAQQLAQMQEVIARSQHSSPQQPAQHNLMSAVFKDLESLLQGQLPAKESDYESDDEPLHVAPADISRRPVVNRSYLIGADQNNVSASSSKLWKPLQGTDPAAAKRYDQELQNKKQASNKLPADQESQDPESQIIGYAMSTTLSTQSSIISRQSSIRSPISKPSSSAMPEKLFFISSSSTPEEVTKEANRMISYLGGKVTAEITPNVTHFVSAKFSKSAKTLQCLVCRAWILHWDYIGQSYKAGRWLPEADFEWNEERLMVQETKPSHALIDLVKTLPVIRSRPQKIFASLRALILKCKEDMTGHQQLLEYGGAEFEVCSTSDLQVNRAKYQKFSLVIASTKAEEMDIKRTRTLLPNACVVSTDFILRYLQNPTLSCHDFQWKQCRIRQRDEASSVAAPASVQVQSMATDLPAAKRQRTK